MKYGLLVLLLLVLFPVNVSAQENAGLRDITVDSFTLLKRGMSEQDVIDILGQPAAIELPATGTSHTGNVIMTPVSNSYCFHYPQVAPAKGSRRTYSEQDWRIGFVDGKVVAWARVGNCGYTVIPHEKSKD